MSSCFPIAINKTTLVEDDQECFGSLDDPNRVLIVMDALKEFSIDLIECVLRRFASGNSSKITLLGIKPWLNFTLLVFKESYFNFQLSAKTWSDIWSMDLEDLFNYRVNNVFKNDPKYQKLQRLLDVCKKYGVVPEFRTEMGHALRLRVAEQISSVHATLVVFDRHHDKKYIDFYAEKIPCNMFAVNENGEIHLIKKRRNDTDINGDEI